MKYRQKPVVIDAEVFQWGMEDGVTRYNEYIPKDSHKYPEDMRSNLYPGYLCKYDDLLQNRGFNNSDWKPHIYTIDETLIISEGDYIITWVTGKRSPCNPDIFEDTYEKVEDEPLIKKHTCANGEEHDFGGSDY